MARYFVVDGDPAACIVGSVVDRNERSLADKFTRGAALGAADKPIGLHVAIESPPEAPYPDYFTLQQVPVVSGTFVAALGAVVENFEAFPAELVEPKKAVGGYFVLNVVGRLACLDRAASQATFIDEDCDVILRVKKLALDAQKAAGRDLFRLDEHELLILASERVQRALRGLRGLRLSAAQGWSDSAWF